ncbi:MAG: prepilin-type N-terminal cleavage/methylation domain-containing protein [Candidatus Omnitrophota bacterium]
MKKKFCLNNLLKSNNQKGFLLLEVVLALIILSCGIIAVVSAFSFSLRAQKHAQCYTFAFLLAGNIQQEIESGVIEESKGEELKQFGFFRWAAEREPFDNEEGEESEMINVRVGWREHEKEYEVLLSNLYVKEFIKEVFGEAL